MSNSKGKLLAVLSPAEQLALYGLPDFDEAQRQEYLSLTEAELALTSIRPGVHAQVWCILQIGYFKAKNTFFQFAWEDVQEDLAFVLSRYFADQVFASKVVSKHEHYAQRTQIAKLFGYRLWSGEFLDQLAQQAALIVRIDVTPSFVTTELVQYLNEHKVERPGYTTLQRLISEALSAERSRLADLLAAAVDEPTKAALAELLVRDETLSELAALKQDARDFGWQQMVREREKRATLGPIYRIAKKLLPELGVSQQNLRHYAALANFYTVYDLRRMKPEQAHLYLLCYAWQRFRQLTDNLVAALGYHTKQVEDECSEFADKALIVQQLQRQNDSPKVGRLLMLYVDDDLDDDTPFGDVRKTAFDIMPKEQIQEAGQRLSKKPVSRNALQWHAVDGQARRIRRHLRPLYSELELSSVSDANPWLAALDWMKEVFAKRQRLSQRPLSECPDGTIPDRLKAQLHTFDDQGKPNGIHGDRYEFWVYRQLRSQLESGEIHLDDSHLHRHLSDELVSLESQAAALTQLNIPWLSQPFDAQLSELRKELHEQWQALDRELRDGSLKHLTWDGTKCHLTWRQPEALDRPGQDDAFYARLQSCDAADVFRFVHKHCSFLDALTPLQPRYAKKVADTDSLMAVIVAQAMNHGNLVMSRTSDIAYHILEATYQQYLRLASLRAACDCISNAIAELPIFQHYSFDLGNLYGSVDGQKFSVERPTVKARHSRKYFGRGKGVVAYTLLCNHVPLQGLIIGANEYEGHHVFDIWYRNTSDILPTTITGDMHSRTKANFAALFCFGGRFEPRFTDLNAELANLYCAEDLALYENFLIRPAGVIDTAAIASEKENFDSIIATLGLKEMSHGTLMRKLCTYSETNPTRRAFFEFDKLIRSIYTLRYMRDPQLQRNVHRSQNRLESYHQLRAAIAQVGGKKELTGRTDLEIEISNECGRLLANAVIYYNSAILSALLEKYEATGDEEALALYKATSPVGWQHVHMNGRYDFHGGQAIDLDAIIRDLGLR
jgi:TnpA family transposase